MSVAHAPEKPPHAPLLQARALAYARDDEPVFGPVDLTVDAGDVVLVEGDNGSGKTTLLRILAGVLHHTDGSIRLTGEPLTPHHTAGTTALLGHHLGLKHDLSPLENLRVSIGLNGCRAGVTPASALTTVGLHGYEDEPVRRLSAGQKKRAALARLLLMPATLWLLDEPYANLDREGIELVNYLLAEHTRAGGAALVTSHGAVSHHDGPSRRLRLAP